MDFSFLNQVIVGSIDIVALWLVFWVYLSKPRGRVNKLFVLMTALMFIWVNFACVARLINQVWLSLILIKIAWLVTPLFFASLYFLTILLIQEEKKYLFLTKVIFSLVAASVFTTGFTDLVLKEIKFDNGILSFVYGKGILPFLVAILFIIIATLYILFKKYFQLSGKSKERISFFLVGILIFYLANIVFNIFLPLVAGISQYYYLGDYSLIFLLGFIAYATVKHRLFDITVAIGRVISGILSITTIILSAILVGFLNYGLETPLPFTVIIPFIALLSVLLFQLSKFYDKITARYLYPTFYQSEIAIIDLEEKLTQVLELKELSFLISNTLCDTFKLRKIAILTKELNKENYQIQKVNGFKEKELLSLTRDSFILAFLKKTKKPFGKEELDSIIGKIKKEGKKQKFQSFKDKIIKMKIAVLLPLFFKGKLIAVIILGKKITGESFTVQDLELLRTISFQASIALKNASLYSEIKKRKEELEKFYQLTVGKELRMTELKEKIKELEERLEEKDQ